MAIDSLYSRVLKKRVHLDTFDLDKFSDEWSILPTKIAPGDAVVYVESINGGENIFTLDDVLEIKENDEISEDLKRSYNCILCDGDSGIRWYADNTSVHAHIECMERFIEITMRLANRNSDTTVGDQI